jgi:hypothetical protein
MMSTITTTTSLEQYLLSYSQNLTLPLLLVFLSIFLWIVIKSKSIKTFQSQISMFIIIWIIGVICIA